MPRRNTEGMDVTQILRTRPAHLDQDPTVQQIQQASRRQRVEEEICHTLTRAGSFDTDTTRLAEDN